MTEPIRIFSSPGCPPCHEVERRIVDGQIDGVPVELVNVETENGFKRFNDELERSKAETFSIPSAFHDGKQCEIRLIGDDRLKLTCGGAQ